MNLKKFLCVLVSSLCIFTSSIQAAPTNPYNITLSYEYTDTDGKIQKVPYTGEFFVRNGRVLVPYEYLRSLYGGIIPTYDNIKREIQFEVTIPRGNNLPPEVHTYTQKLQDYVLYRDGLNCYTGDVRSDYIANPKQDKFAVFVSIRACVTAFMDDTGTPILELDWNEDDREVIVRQHKR